MQFSVLLIEDDELIVRMLRRSMPKGFDLCTATTLQEAKRILNSTATFDAIVFDGYVPPEHGRRDLVNTLPLLPVAKERFPQAPLIAYSGDFSMLQKQQKEGCTHACEKHELTKFISGLFALITE